MQEARPILLAEPDHLYAELIKTAFMKAGAPNSVDVVTDGEAGKTYLIEGIKGERPLPIIIILALRLQGFYDFKFLRWIKAQTELDSIPVSVFSGANVDDEDRKAQELGAFCYAEKPVSFPQLAALAQKVRERWLD